MPTKTVKTLKTSKPKRAWYKSPMAILIFIAIFLAGVLSGGYFVRTNAAGSVAPPTNLSANVISSTTVSLSWTPSTTTSSSLAYNIFRNGSQIDTLSTWTPVSGTNIISYQDTSALANSPYSYYVQAATANGTANSTQVSLNTPAGAPLVADIKGTVATYGSKGKKGTVTAGTGIAGATVSVVYGGALHSVMTDANGNYDFGGLPVGQYNITFVAPGHGTMTYAIQIFGASVATANATFK
jgi:cytoskeletal protein RodZ